MIRLRPFKLMDINYIVHWLDNEYDFQKWCAGKFQWPLTEAQLEDYYHRYERDEFGWSMTALDGQGIPVGHVLMRMADYQENQIHLGFVLLAASLRGKGWGKAMLDCTKQYAFTVLNVNRLTLGVFDNNSAAHFCYQAAGFRDVSYDKDCFSFQQESWGVYNMVLER